MEQPLEVVSITPRDGATNVSPRTTIRLTFGRMMDREATLAAVEILADLDPISWTGEWREGSTVLIIRPDEPLPESAEVEVLVSTAAKDSAGRPLARRFDASFTTGADAGPEEGHWGSMNWNQGSWR